ncbi:MAG: ASCH domain-containing protein [Deltaproteobacteria bacterium]|nr:ASCH domain-containing protein [Deltaproteobacteria bacterium]
MAQTENNDVILLSIHPEFAKAIMGGKKKIEFRKLNIPKSIKQVVLYATAPERKIVGYFSVKKIVEATPTELWKVYKRISGVKRNYLLNYYKNSQLGVGILVSDVVELQNPIPIFLEDSGFRPTQSFSYVEKRLWYNLKRRRKKQEPTNQLSG